MTRMIREFAEVRDPVSLDQLIETLSTLRAMVPDGADVTVRMRGNDVFGQRLSLSWLRAQTDEEAALDARYSDALAAALRLDMAA